MSTETEVAGFYRLLLSKNEPEETACVLALGLCHALMPDANEEVVREVAARAIASVRITRASVNDNSSAREESDRSNNKFPSGR
jgi:hypothetical protein